MIGSLPSKANKLDKQKHYADSLFTAEHYYEAITEYKRLLFFDENEIYNYEANYKIGLCYKSGAKFNDAIKYFKISLQNCSNNKSITKLKTQIVRVNILRRTIPEALLLLSELESTSIEPDSIIYWRGWAFMMHGDWDLAATEFEKISINHPLKVLSDSVHSAQYSVQLAKIMSHIIPGSGQFYTGNYLSGTLSLAWNGLWGYLTINAFVTDRAVEGILMGSLLWTRFYRGNFQNAHDFAIDKNIEISNNAYRYLSTKYIGEKP